MTRYLLLLPFVTAACASLLLTRRDAARALSGLERIAVRGGYICYDSALFDQPCPPRQIYGLCADTDCDYDFEQQRWVCPEGTKGSWHYYQAWSTGCSVGDAGYWQCATQMFRCEQWVDCWGCVTVWDEQQQAVRVVCNFTSNFGGTPIVQDHYPFSFGCTQA
jgi:hypothetical protein